MTTIDDNPNRYVWPVRTLHRNPKDAKVASADLVLLCHGAAIKAGLFTDLETGERRKVPAERFLELIAGELAEARDAVREGEMDKHLPHRLAVEVEVADILILAFNMCGHLGLDIGNAIAEKVEYNLHRGDHKPEARRAAGGKKC